MFDLSRIRRSRCRRLLPSGPLVFSCIALIAASVWIYPSVGPISKSNRKQEEAASLNGTKLAVQLKTKTRGVLDIPDNVNSKFLLVQCHRGQFSNRLDCLKLGILLARVLQRVLVMPIFTDVVPPVDVSKYVSLDCLRRNSLAVTFEEFREQLCRGVGLEAPQPVPEGAAFLGVSNATRADFQRGVFCEDHAVLHLETSFSLEDYRGYDCWSRREDLINARDLGIQASGCTHVPPSPVTPPQKPSYSLADIRRHFESRTEKVVLFLDLFGVGLPSSTADLADTISEPGQMCSWMPTEAAAAAADTVMQILIPPPLLMASSAIITVDSNDGPMAMVGNDGTAVISIGDMSLGLSNGLDPTIHRALSMGRSEELTREPPPVRLRGARRYAAVHLRRSDWFYYCGGSSNCFYSITEAAAWLNETIAAQGLDTLYVSTNADNREKMMLRRAIGARVLYWEDALMRLRSWQMEGTLAAVDAAPEQAEDDRIDVSASGEEGAPPEWLISLPLNDDLMVQMVEKAICMQASFFVSSIGSTFSNQIRAFRNGGLEDHEWVAIENKFPSMVTQGSAESAITPNAGAGGGADAVASDKVMPLHEGATFLCDTRLPWYPDERRLPDYHNPKIFLQQMMPLLAPIRDRALRIWHRITRWTHEESAASAAPPPEWPHWQRPTLSQVLKAPARILEWLTLVAEDGHAMAAANRFVDMYTGGAMVALVVEGRLKTPPGALVDCVVAAAATVGAISLHVTMRNVPGDQQVLLMQELEGRTALHQVTRMGGPEQERDSTFTLMWRGEGLSRHAEPALLEELPTFLERVDTYILAKSRVLLGDRQGVLFRHVENTRRVFSFTDPRDGACGQAELLLRNA
ncbi:hypothetical protein Vretimale_18824 [Volvox reticuliferus]|uniref:O-fucosyltransferase family protein n=2 Tax=Volvox reticuliferus TaxID=1737510 RepID=A0A8J4LZC4_9CHLO|nr:hypothetical protein Vretimale_18824 [Volvox reticuliferus]